MRNTIRFFIRKSVVPALSLSIALGGLGFTLLALIPHGSPVVLLIVLTTSIFFFLIGYFFYQSQPKQRATKYYRILESFGDPHRIFLITNKKYTVYYASDAFHKLFPNIHTHGIRTIIDQLDGEDAYKKFKSLLKNAGENKARLTHCIRLKNHYLQFSIYEFFKDGVLLWRIENLLPQKESKTFLTGTDFLDRLDVRQIFEQAPAGIIILDHHLEIQGMNETFKRNFLKTHALQPKEIFTSLIAPEKQKSILEGLQKVLSEELQHYHNELKFRWDDRTSAIVYVSLIKQSSLTHPGLLLEVFDNYDQEQLQLHVLQSHKLQALGQLAGGIAHDFNNLLTAMIGFCDLLLSRHYPGDQSFTDIMQIKQNANRAANLVRQLLAFSRQQTLQPKVLDISEILSNLSVLLQRLIGASIKLRIVYGRDLGCVKVDEGQFERVIINLVVNARDALSERDQGEIIIQTRNEHLDDDREVNHETITKGDYVVVEVIDNGVGISPEHVNKVFDPFFSTKEVGSGTGLGLSTVYGIIKQTDGYIFAESKKNHGTKFIIYLPLFQSETLQTEQEPLIGRQPHSISDLTGVGRVLLVEDEDAVRLFVARALRDKGYEVIEASTGDEGLHHLQEARKSFDKKIDLMITDIVMPHMDGSTLANKALKIFPALKTIFISGYAEDSFRAKLKHEGDIHFLSKPFNLRDLARLVKEVMDQPSENAETYSRDIQHARLRK